MYFVQLMFFLEADILNSVHSEENQKLRIVHQHSPIRICQIHFPVEMTFTYWFANMSNVKRVLTTVIRVSSKLEPYVCKTADSKMNHLTLYLFLLVSGLTAAYLASYLPVLFVSVFGGKRQLSNSEVLTAQFDTSIVKRTRQQTIPVNPGTYVVGILNLTYFQNSGPGFQTSA